MNFKTLWKAELTIALNDSDTSNLYTSTRRQKAINDAVEEFADLTECYTRYSTITCSCNVTEYRLLSSAVSSTDFVRFAKAGVEFVHTSSGGVVQHVSGDDFPRRDLEFRNRYDSGWRSSTTPVEVPTGWYLRADGGNQFIGLNEPPDVGSSETAKILMPFVAMPQPMTSSGAEPYTFNSSVRTDLRMYHKALPHYAAYKLLPLIGDKQGAQEHLQTFMGYVTRYLQATRPRGGREVTFARSYLGEARSRMPRGETSPGNGYTWLRG